MASVIRSRSLTGMLAVGVAAFSIGLASGLWPTSPPSATAQEECLQPSPDGCPLPIGSLVQGVLNDPSTTHAWLVDVAPGIDLFITLTFLPADYELRVSGPDGSMVGQVNNAGFQDEILQVANVGAGIYRIEVGSPSGESSEFPYTLTVTSVITSPTTLTPYDVPAPRQRFSPY